MEAVTLVLLGAFLGMIGGVTQLLTVPEKTTLQIMISLIMGCAAGTIAGVALHGVDSDKILMVAIIALGYIGADILRG